MNKGVSRRGFLNTLAGGAIGGALLYAFPPETKAQYTVARNGHGEPTDEQFWRMVRRQFPLKHTPVFLNNGTIGPSPYVVIDAVRMEMEEVERTGKYGGWEIARPKIARFINAAESEISLTHNVTEGINVIACGLPLKRGDEIILTDHEHAGNAVPWLARARRDGVVIRMLHIAPTAAETLNRLDALITRRTRVIAVPHITCTTGQVLPAKDICRFARDKGIWVMMDAAHTPGMLPLDVKEMGCDFLATCGHKWMLGPKGTGFLYIRKELLESVEPYWTGALADDGWNVESGTLRYRNDAQRYDFGTQSSALYAGLANAIDFLGQIGMENIAQRGQSLAARLRKGLLEIGERVEILTPDEPGASGSMVGFRIKDYPFDTLGTILREEHGYITRVVPENGLNSNRISTHIYNSPAEVDGVIQAIKDVIHV